MRDAPKPGLCRSHAGHLWRVIGTAENVTAGRERLVIAHEPDSPEDLFAWSLEWWLEPPPYGGGMPHFERIGD